MKKKITTINSKGRISNSLLKLYDLLIKPYLEITKESGKSQARLLDDILSVSNTSFFQMRSNEIFKLPGVLLHGSRKIPGISRGREIAVGDIIIVRRDDLGDRIDVGKLNYASSSDETFEISYAELKFVMDRCDYV